MPSPAPPIKRAREVFHSIKTHASPTNRRNRKPVIEALVLTAFDDIPGFLGEMKPWRDAYDFTKTVNADGVPAPVRVTEKGLGIVLTGIGEARCGNDYGCPRGVRPADLDETIFLTVGVPGGHLIST